MQYHNMPPCMKVCVTKTKNIYVTKGKVCAQSCLKLVVYKKTKLSGGERDQIKGVEMNMLSSVYTEEVDAEKKLCFEKPMNVSIINKEYC